MYSINKDHLSGWQLIPTPGVAGSASSVSEQRTLWNKVGERVVASLAAGHQERASECRGFWPQTHLQLGSRAVQAGRVSQPNPHFKHWAARKQDRSNKIESNCLDCWFLFFPDRSQHVRVSVDLFFSHPLDLYRSIWQNDATNAELLLADNSKLCVSRN